MNNSTPNFKSAGIIWKAWFRRTWLLLATFVFFMAKLFCRMVHVILLFIVLILYTAGIGLSYITKIFETRENSNDQERGE